VNSFFRKKNLDEITQEIQKLEYCLRRVLGPVQITLMGIGAIIGAGIFATIGTAAAGDAVRPGAGPALIISFVITAIACGFIALCYAEFASMVPISGSAYTYSYATLGELVAWIIGWDLIIEYAVGNIAVAISWANYFKTFLRGFGLFIPDWLSMDYRSALKIVDETGASIVFRNAPHLFGFPIVFNLPAVLIVTVITIVLVWGIKESSRFNAGMVLIKLVVLGFFVAVGASYVKPENWVPFAPNGLRGISAGAAIVFFAYIGFDAVSTTAEESRNPKRDMPVGIIASLVICTLIYVIVSGVFTGLISYPDLKTKLFSEQAEPLTMALQSASPNLGWAVGIVSFGSIVAHTAVLLVFQLGQPRIFFSMARDGLLPPVFAKVHPRFKTPHIATIITGVFVAFFAAFASIDEMVDLTNIGTLFAFIIVGIGVIVLKIKEPQRPRPFKVPHGWVVSIPLFIVFCIILIFLNLPVAWKVILFIAGFCITIFFRNFIIPLIGIFSCFYLIYYLPPTSWLRFAGWLNIGLVIYVLYGLKHSKLLSIKKEEEKTIQVDFIYFLLIAGMILLFITRGLDIYLKSAQNLFDIYSWLQPSVFMIIPLFLHSFIFPASLYFTEKEWELQKRRLIFYVVSIFYCFILSYLVAMLIYNIKK